VVDHFGRPDAGLGVNDPGFRYLLSAASSRRVWVKISGSYRNGTGGRGEATALEAIPLMREAFGLDRLVWGSDWPHGQFESTQSYGVALAALSAWLPQQADRDIVLGRTAAELFRF
jgi:predicted TIM-barrel fold metal-dependent hydrolase